MSLSIKGLRPPSDFIPANITLNYLEDEETLQVTQQIYLFFADVIQKYSARARLNTYVFSVYLPALCFDDRVLTRYMSHAQRDKMRQCAITAEKVNGFIQQLHRKDGIAKIAADLPHYAQYPTLALTAHLLGGDVTQEQVVSTCLLYHAINQFIKRPYFVQVYRTKTHYETFFHKCDFDDFEPAFRTISLFEDRTFVQRFLNLDDQQTSALLDRLKSKPDSEKYYHIIALPLGPIASPGHLIVSRIINRFKPVILEKDPVYGLKRSVIVIPSFSILQECSYVLYGDDAMDYVPLIGVCTEKEIEHFKMQDKCVLQVGTQEARLPRVADNQEFGPFCRVLHDWYHGERGCWLGDTGRRAVRYIVGHIFGSAKDPQMRALVWNLLNGELWKRDQHFGHLFTAPGMAWTDTYKRAVIRNMALLTPFWKLEFEITPEQLFPTDKSIYDAIAVEITTEERQAAEHALFQYYNTLSEKNMQTHFRLGWLYCAGYGTAVSYRSAIEHWTLCGHAQALYNIAQVYKEKTTNPFHHNLVYCHYLEAAEKGHRQAQCEIGWWYYSANAFVNFEQRFDLALNFFKKAAEQAHPVAVYNLGVMYRDGQGVPIDLDQALTYFQRAADLGLPSAQYEMGVWHLSLPRNFKEAKRHFKLAAAQNHPAACYALGFHYAKGWGGDKDPQLAYIYLKKSAELGHPPAIHLLKNTAPPKLKKRSLFAQAFALGSPAGRERLKRVKS
jgi:TPR repeat protein